MEGRNNNSVENCIDACQQSAYGIAGVEFGQECYCGIGIDRGGMTISSSECMLACSGDSSEVCGGPNRLAIYYTVACASGRVCGCRPTLKSM
ncbi:hypothetical protein EI94DRAFT_797758 [Lactarius quietus]|nr:hypothetical protein EI94DRAFT_797758 [Lactarius quietus]